MVTSESRLQVSATALPLQPDGTPSLGLGRALPLASRRIQRMVRPGSMERETLHDFETSSPDVIAQAIVNDVGGLVDYRTVETDGAARAAALIGEML